MVCFTGGKPVPFTDKPYRTLVCIRKTLCTIVYIFANKTIMQNIHHIKIYTWKMILFFKFVVILFIKIPICTFLASSKNVTAW